ncbi:hypothetical protein FHS18_002793 [Paenibacillus phyllosphaerae]|uniref:Uncharacterized protein n=1 Tax=Paenibacillus phyllosphaerae TaxID=274593 RepID=A0A7W5FMY1_9BACL|nr:hypothetical protein [Paenibacillus phyllosphaerae]MBB3110726.1 hypothetical protein [Paenibacillus phyllosphaerae]
MTTKRRDAGRAIRMLLTMAFLLALGLGVQLLQPPKASAMLEKVISPEKEADTKQSSAEERNDDRKAGAALTLPDLQLDTPLLTVGLPRIQLDVEDSEGLLPNLSVEVPSIEIHTPVADVTTTPTEVGTEHGSRLLPELQVVAPAVKVGTPIATIETTPGKVGTDGGDGLLPDLQVEVPGVKVDTPIAAIETTPSTVDADHDVDQLPEVQVELPTTSVEIPAVPVVNEPVDDAPSSAPTVSSEQGEGLAPNEAPAAEESDELSPAVDDKAAHVNASAVSQPNRVSPEALPLLTSRALSSAGYAVQPNELLPSERAVSAAPVADQAAWPVRGEHPAVAVQAVPAVGGGGYASSSGASGPAGQAWPSPISLWELGTELNTTASSLRLIEHYDVGTDQWSQAPPGQPPQDDSFSHVDVEWT